MSRVLDVLIVTAAAAIFAPPVSAQYVSPQLDPETVKAEKKLFASVNQAEMVFVAKVEDIAYGPVAQSFPPIYYMTISFKDEEFFRGRKPDMLTFSYNIRQVDRPEFDRKKSMLVAAHRSATREGGLQISLIIPSDERIIQIAKNAVSMPLGWEFSVRGPVSPWANNKGWKWPANADVNAMIKCSATGRPALLAGENIKVSVEQIIPKDAHEFQNPYGDGKFKVTVTNEGQEETEVPALLTDGDEIFWSDSFLLIASDEPRLLPSSKKLDMVRAVTLKPKESVSGEIDVIAVDGIEWPRGGSRVYFSFCLGEKSAQNFFYYFSRLHDPIREKALKELSDK